MHLICDCMLTCTRKVQVSQGALRVRITAGKLHPISGMRTDVARGTADFSTRKSQSLVSQPPAGLTCLVIDLIQTPPIAPLNIRNHFRAWVYVSAGLFSATGTVGFEHIVCLLTIPYRLRVSVLGEYWSKLLGSDYFPEFSVEARHFNIAKGFGTKFQNT